MTDRFHPDGVAVERAGNAERANAIANDPMVRPYIADAAGGEIDLGPQVAKPENVLLLGDHGAMLFLGYGGGDIAEAHTMVLPSRPEGWSERFLRSCGRWMFTHTSRWEILTRIPQPLEAARRLAQKIDMQFAWRVDHPQWPYLGERVSMEVWSIRLETWLAAQAGFEARGEWLHERLAAEAKRLGIQEPAHANDPVHNIYAGIACEMGLAGQIAKGVGFYNRWALASRHKPIAVESVGGREEVVFDIGRLCFEDGRIEVKP